MMSVTSVTPVTSVTSVVHAVNASSTSNNNLYIRLSPEDSRLTTMPIAHEDLWKYYKTAQSAYWTANEIPMTEDVTCYMKMTPREQRCVREILGFFATSDAIVNINLAQRFKAELSCILEIGYFYDMQILIENIHAEMYSIQLLTIIPDDATRTELFDAVNTNPAIGLIAKWMYDTIDSKESLGVRLLRMACVEGLFFSGCFCIIYWFAYRKLMPGLVTANMLIARDEGLHTDFALHVYRYYILPETKPTVEEVHDIITSAVTIAFKFISHMMPEPMPEMNAGKMDTYIKYLANDLLKCIENTPAYPSITENPMDFMNMLGMPERTNFFEYRSTNYSKPTMNVVTSSNTSNEITQKNAAMYVNDF
jgi:ribonucleotide reductase beta subunit family protein with ferritin-like domain